MEIDPVFLAEKINALRADGYVVVPGVLTPDTCDGHINKIWDWLRDVSPAIRRDDPATWSDASGNWPESVKGIFQHYGVGHTQVMWDVRSEPNVIGVFERLWGTNELLVSFDGLNVMRPPKYAGVDVTGYRYNMWWHTDQSFRKVGLHCVQGFVNLEESTDRDGCLMVLKGSHLHHQALHARFGSKGKGDWYKLTDEEVEWMKQQDGVTMVKVTAPKGALVLWDSRTIHCNIPPSKRDDVEVVDGPRIRHVCYVCMTPRALIKPNQLAKKVGAFNELRTTSHWPHQVKLNSLRPNSYGKPIVGEGYRVPRPVLTDRARQLAGVLAY